MDANIHEDLDPLDLLRTPTGVMDGEPGTDGKRARRRLVDIPIAGVRKQKQILGSARTFP